MPYYYQENSYQKMINFSFLKNLIQEDDRNIFLSLNHFVIFFPCLFQYQTKLSVNREESKNNVTLFGICYLRTMVTQIKFITLIQGYLYQFTLRSPEVISENSCESHHYILSFENFDESYLTMASPELVQASCKVSC